MSDLRVVANGFMFYLGDTPGGATLVGLNATTGAKVCAAAVELKEVQLVGLGQSLDYDSSTDTLLLSGVSRNGTGHTIYRAPADRCGRFQYAGTCGVHPLTHPSTHTQTHPVTHTHTHTLSLSLSHTHTLTHSHSRTHSSTYSLTHSRTHSLTH